MKNTLQYLCNDEQKEETTKNICFNSFREVSHILRKYPVFGVFVTLIRGANDTKKIYGEKIDENLQVQGCLGFINKHTETNEIQVCKQPKFLLKKIRDLHFSMLTDDNRYKQFRNLNINNDTQAKIQLTFLLMPMYAIDADGYIVRGKIKTNKQFSNNEDGIMTFTPFGTATYLPNVLPNQSFTSIKKSLIGKALGRHKLSDETRFKIYQTAIFKGFKALEFSKYIIRLPPIILIPHAGPEFAGVARYQAFSKIKNRDKIETIFFIAAVHDIEQFHVKQTDNSYEWVYSELAKFFPNAQHVVYYPKSWDEANILAHNIYKDQLLCKHCLLIGTTDLIHYGPKYNYFTKTKDPHQLVKKLQKRFIKVLQSRSKYVSNYSQQMKQLHLNNPHLACGPYSIYTILKYLEIENRDRFSKVTAYYDSTDKRYVQKVTDDDNFVYYVTIIYIN